MFESCRVHGPYIFPKCHFDTIDGQQVRDIAGVANSLSKTNPLILSQCIVVNAIKTTSTHLTVAINKMASLVFN